jgi:hypothetical protein
MVIEVHLLAGAGLLIKIMAFHTTDKAAVIHLRLSFELQLTQFT